MSGLVVRKQVTLAANAVTVIDPGITILNPNDYGKMIVTPLPPLSGWENISIESNPTSAGVAFTNAGSQVIVNVKFEITHTILGIGETDAYAGATTVIVPALPADSKTNFQYRLFAVNTNRISGTSLLANLSANPTVRTTAFANVSLHLLTQSLDPTNISFIGLVAALSNSQKLTPAMPAYPAARVFPGQSQPFSDWVDIDYWKTMADSFRNLADIRLPGDPRIGIDAENYATLDSSEPTVNTLAAHGYTVQQFQIAIQPFIDMLLEEGVVPIGMYPTVFGEPDDLPLFGALILDAVGADRCEIWWERTFGYAELYRQNTGVGGFDTGIASQSTAVGDYNRARGLQTANHRCVDDDDELKVWGKLINPGTTPPVAGAPNAAFGNLLPWLFDETRAGTAVGTPAWLIGTDLSALNAVDTVYYARPLMGAPTTVGGTDMTTVGTRATALTSEIWAGNANTIVLTPSAINNTNITGIQLALSASATPGTTWVAIRLTGAFPAVNTDPWTHKLFDFTIPAAIAADTPLWLYGQNNVGVACLYYLQASNKIVLLVNASGVNSYDVLAAPARDTAIRIVIGRSGLTWRTSANGAAAVSNNTPTQAGVHQSPFYGIGLNTSLTVNTLVPCPNMVLTGQAQTYLSLLTPSQFATVSSQSTPYSTFNYPYGRGT